MKLHGTMHMLEILPIMLVLHLMLFYVYYVQNYAGIADKD